MALFEELRTLGCLAFGCRAGADHAGRMEAFYAPQAGHYDRFRERMLHGREGLYGRMPAREGGVWIDFGGGTGRCLDYLGPRLRMLERVYVVDVSGAMLGMARRRIAERGWSNVEAVQACAVDFVPAAGRADVITFSYALSMMPDWAAVLEHACALLAPGGHVGVVDYYVSRADPPAGMARHGWWTRTIWPAWFGRGGVRVGADVLPRLQDLTCQVWLQEGRGRLPYVPVGRIPWFGFVGRRRAGG